MEEELSEIRFALFNPGCGDDCGVHVTIPEEGILTMATLFVRHTETTRSGSVVRIEGWRRDYN